MGNGDGTFLAGVNYGAGAGSNAVAIGDFTGDNHVDLAVANSYARTVSILMGNGDGTFQTAVNYPITTGPNGAVVADFNGDGRLDVAVANDIVYSSPGGALSVLINNCVSVTPTPTSTATPVPVLVGHVTWQGRAVQPSAGQIMPLTLTLKSGVTEMNYPAYLTTDASGFFTVDVSTLPGGTYQWRVKGPSYLATSGVVGLTGGVVQAEMGLQRVGDLNGDNLCNLLDFNPMKANFGTGGAPPVRQGP
jgi:hypothetical protein